MRTTILARPSLSHAQPHIFVAIFNAAAASIILGGCQKMIVTRILTCGAGVRIFNVMTMRVAVLPIGVRFNSIGIWGIRILLMKIFWLLDVLHIVSTSCLSSASTMPVSAAATAPLRHWCLVSLRGRRITVICGWMILWGRWWSIRVLACGVVWHLVRCLWWMLSLCCIGEGHLRYFFFESLDQIQNVDGHCIKNSCIVCLGPG